MHSNVSSGIELPPSPFVRHVSELVTYGPLDVLDVGCCMGRNALYLASLSHNVIAVDTDVDAVVVANSMAPANLHVVAAEATKLPFYKKFDLILLNEVLHQIPVDETKLVINSIKSLTKPGGFNAVSGYIGDKPEALESRQLYDYYANSNWNIIEYSEDTSTSIRYGQTDELTSLARLFAIRK